MLTISETQPASSAQDVEDHPFIRAAASIVSALGPDWKLIRTEYDTMARAEHPVYDTISFRQIRESGRDRMEIKSRPPLCPAGETVDIDLKPEVFKCGLKRDARDVAKDLEKRFLPKHHAYISAMRQAVSEKADHLEDINETINELKKGRRGVTKVLTPSEDGVTEGVLEFQEGPCRGVLTANSKIRVSLQGLTLEQARRVLDAFAASE